MIDPHPIEPTGDGEEPPAMGVDGMRRPAGVVSWRACAAPLSAAWSAEILRAAGWLLLALRGQP